MNYRQVHLDFHTSEKIEGIGSKFNKDEFQHALKTGCVNSITLFSKCHHGWAYHPSAANEIHPHLTFDLLKAQIDACHEIGVKTPVYLSAGLDEKMALKHPEWLIRKKDQSTTWVPSFDSPGYHRMCFNTPYVDYLLAQIKETSENYEADGIFLDIVGVIPCYCNHCITTLLERGKDPLDNHNVLELAEEVYASYCKRVRETVDSVKKDLPVFHNGGHIRAGRRDLAHFNTHLELESLPTGGWGYDHFPMSAAYARTLDIDFLGMTGKFHTTWGEFGGFKHPNALKYEAALSAANGAKCSIGDQLHPTGAMDIATYELIGEAYQALEKAEPWLENAKNIADIAVLSNEAMENYLQNSNHSTGQSALICENTSGAIRILLEGKYLFNVVDTDEDFNKYKVLILADDIRLDDMMADKISSFIKNGGKVLATGKSGLFTDKQEFAVDLGVKYIGTSDFKPSYIRPGFEIPALKNSAYVMYAECQNIELAGGEEIAAAEQPYFNRAPFYFCSHQHTPTSGEKLQPAIVRSDSGIYISYDIFKEYSTVGSIYTKQIVMYALNLLLDNTIETNLPAQGVITLTEQGNKKIVHLLYASPVYRGKNTEVIEDLLPILNTVVKVKAKASKVYLAPQMTEIPFVQNGEYCEFTVDKFTCWQMVVLEK